MARPLQADTWMYQCPKARAVPRLAPMATWMCRSQTWMSGKKARRRISSCIEGGGDYLQVVVAHDGNRSLSDSLAELDDDDDEDPADLSDDE
mmetsp:Transcript_11397/g.34348  ORF Transcript_11397/g.34348 Transcript_11397/m.34348 type:complete len:92 (+) Transcript_11397:618-893(+)